MAKITQKEVLPDGKVWANPPKNFFVTMLTRDIALMDAIMDLVDNCIDGVHREVKRSGKTPSEFLYKSYYADITLSKNDFILKDNCGGIPLEVARQYAFKMGRSEDYHADDNLETLGMYGIGMKRAIFKIGGSASVTSWHSKNMFKVDVPKDWTSIDEWMFDYSILKKSDLKGVLKEAGTAVHVSHLHKSISKQFQDNDGFIKDLKLSLRNHYGYIIKQGFKIMVNGIKIDSIDLNIITTDPKKDKQGIRPYVYSATVDDVEIEVMVGFYRPLATEDEIEQELEGDYATSESENAGITVLCNDRVVLYCDKTFLTGWGESPVPKYHTQFIAIAGVVHFRSNNPIQLPVTTTKRGLDTSSPIYALSKAKIKEGLKLFTSFTNHWKKPSEERAQLFQTTKKINALKPGSSRSPEVKLESKKREDEGKYQIPILPKPKATVDNKLTPISFNREKEKIDRIRDYFLEGKRKSPAEVGGWCFDKVYSQTK